MPADECIDCGGYHPGGEGLTAGRCSVCHKLYLEKQGEPVREPVSSEEEEEEE